MQVNNTNNYSQKSSPAFKANHISRAVVNVVKKSASEAKPVLEQPIIDIYAIGVEDIGFLKKIAKCLDLATLRDKLAIFPEGIKTTNSLIRKSLIKASKISDIRTMADTEGVLLAVKDGKEITGILNYAREGDMKLKGMAAWSDVSTQVRENLVQSFLNTTIKSPYTAAYTVVQKSKSEVASKMKGMGFNASKSVKNPNKPDEPLHLRINYESIKSTRKKIIDRNITTQTMGLKKRVDLNEAVKFADVK